MFRFNLKRTAATLAALVTVALPAATAAPICAATPAAPAFAVEAPVSVTAIRTTLVKAPGRVGRGYYASVGVRTRPAARCYISVHYKSGLSVAQGLYAKTAPSSGYLYWSWKVGTRTTSGSWPVYISCGAAGSVSAYVTVP